MVTSHSGAFITHHRPFFHFGLETLELAVKDECVWGTSQSELASDLPPWGGGASFCLAAGSLSVRIKGGALEPLLHAVSLLLLGPTLSVDHGPRPGHSLRFTISHS